METESVIDVEALLAPPALLDAAAELGAADADLYLSLKDWRAEARVAERDALQSPELEESVLRAGQRSWSQVVEGGARLLADVKDLETAGWLCEALLRLEGFPGLARGLELLARLIETYWDAGLRPAPDEDGDEGRLASLFGLLGVGGAGSLLQPVKLVPLTDRASDGAPVALWTVETVFAPPGRSEDPEVSARLAAKRSEEIEAVTRAIAGASHPFLRESAAGLEASLAMLDRLLAAVTSRAAVPRFGSGVAQALGEALRTLRDQGAAAFAGQAGAQAGGPPAVAVEAGGPAEQAPGADGFGSRDAVLAAVERAAAWFDRAEPQSPTAAGLRDVVRRARLPLEALLAELLPDDEQRALFLQRAGIRVTPSSSYDGYGN